MKHFFSLLLLFCGMSAFAQVVDIPDAKFRAHLLTQPCAELYSSTSSLAQYLDKNSDGVIQISEAEDVKRLQLSNDTFSTISGIAHFRNLKEIGFYSSQIGEIDLTGNKRLTNLQSYYSKITNLEVTGLDSLRSIYIPGAKLSKLNLSGVTNLFDLLVAENALDSLDLSEASMLFQVDCAKNKLNYLNVNNLDRLASLDASDNLLDTIVGGSLPELTSLNLTKNQFNYFDATNYTNLIWLSIENNHIMHINISNNENLQGLSVSKNKISTLNLSENKKLGSLFCSENLLTELNLSNNTNLSFLNCSANLLNSLSLELNNKISSIYCSQNILKEITLGEQPELTSIYCSNNELKSIDITQAPKLRALSIAENQFTYIDLSKNPKLNGFICANNLLENIDLSNNPVMRWLICDQNLLRTINVKNGSKIIDTLSFSANPDLKYICIDDNEFDRFQSLATDYGYTDVSINSYCNFDPGGPVYNFQSQTRYDADLNNCSSTDPGFTTKYQITDSIGLNQQVTPFEGVLKMALNAGKYNIKPIIDTVLFNIEPKSVAVDFPAMSSPHQADFCVAPINVVHDLEVALMPTTPLRPGFDARFKLVCTNKGNQIAAGSVSLVYDEDRLDFISSDISASTQNAGFASWNFTNLHPNASFEAEITFNCNSPVETPAVNIGDILSFYAEAIGLTPETTPANNTFALRQTVVGSYDPNEKTCLQGERLDPDMVGQYVHYLIRFENTGTYPAEFVVVKDVINPGMFDINTLEIIDASHPMYARTSDGNVVEFIFENINLPFDDANNDGYVAFKIKTRPWLKIGDTLANTAAIYFDYNHPIITNTAQTVVAPLVDTYAPGDLFAVRMTPNPATNRVYFKSEAAIEHVALSSTEGRLLYSGPLTNGALSLENVAPGVYWVRVYTETGTQTLKLIKS